MSLKKSNYWGDYSLDGLNIVARPYEERNFSVSPKDADIPPHFWGKNQTRNQKPRHTKGYKEAKNLIGRGSVGEVNRLAVEARRILKDAFSKNLEPHEINEKSCGLVKLRLSENLANWKNAETMKGRVLGPKKTGLNRVSQEVLEIFGAENWPEGLLTNSAMYGCGLANFLIGAADVGVLFSNYAMDMAFYYEHGYNKAFPSSAFESVINKALTDFQALQTTGGCERRAAIVPEKSYIVDKINLERANKSALAYKSARLPGRRELQLVSFFESSLVAMGVEAIARGFDPGAVMSDLIFSSPMTDVVDVGSDLLNSEVMNSILNAADIVDTGVVSEAALRRVYDAYAAVGARMLTERWHEPVARMSIQLFPWHMQNDRHFMLRRALYGWPKARKTPCRPQREADLDEAFDKRMRTTGFYRPLEPRYECNAEVTCNHVQDFLAQQEDRHAKLLDDLWHYLVTGPLEYVNKGEVDEQTENELAEGSRVTMARLYKAGLVLEMTWVIAHAQQHAWQVNYLLEAVMFGGILDGGELIGKLDRID